MNGKLFKSLTAVCLAAFALLILTFNILSFAALADSNLTIYDAAGVLSDSEETELVEKLDATSERYGIDSAVIIENRLDYGYDDIYGLTEDKYSELGFGCGENNDGILLYICTESRDWCIYSHGYAAAEGESLYDAVEENCIPYLSSEDWYSAIDKYAEICNSYSELLCSQNYSYGEQEYGYKTDISGRAGFESERSFNYSNISGWVFLAVIIIPLIFAFAMTAHKLSQMNTVKRQNFAENYKVGGSMNIIKSRDIYLYSTIHKVARPKDNGRTSSGGPRSYGGGSRSSFGGASGGRAGKF